MRRTKRRRLGNAIGTLVSLSVMAAALIVPSAALAAVSVSKASLSSGSLRVEGKGAKANATITVSSPESTARGKADGQGQFKVSASGFTSSTCKATVGDGTTSVVVTFSGCTPASTPPPPPPPPASTPALSSVTLSHTSLNSVGTLAVGEVLLAGAASAPVVVALTSSHPAVAPVRQASVQVAAGSNQAVFTVEQVAAVPAPTIVTITASSGGVTKTTQLTINPTPAMAFFAQATDMGPGFVGANFVDTAVGIGTTLGVSPAVGCVRFAIIAGQLPNGLFLFDPNTGSTPCKLDMVSVSGVPTTVQTNTFTLRATDDAGQQASIAVTIRINPPLGLTITPQLPWSPIVGSFSNLWITGSGGVVPYTWTRSAGQFPPGMSLVQDNRDGPLVRVTGTPTAAGAYTFTLRVTDAKGATGTQTISVTVGSA